MTARRSDGVDMSRWDVGDGRDRRAAIADLRTRFEAARSDLAVLEEINKHLRADASEEGGDLQADVMMAIMALRSPVRVEQTTKRQSVLSGVLSDRGLTKPDGRPLYGYRVSDVRFAQLRSGIERLHKDFGQQDFVNSGGPAFVLFCAEWFRREYNGGHYAWRMPNPEIFGSLGNRDTQILTRQGLEWWRREPRRSGGMELRLQSLVLEGGFPTRLLESREYGKVPTHLRGLIARLESRISPTEDEALSLSYQSTTALGQFDHEGFHLLCADLTLAILTLRREVQARAPGGVAASIWLDAARPDWRDDLPISLSGDGAKRLLDDLVSLRVERLTSDAVCQRLLVRTESGWEPAVDIGASGEIALSPNLIHPSIGRVRAFASGALSNVLAGELAMLEPPTEAGEHWLCRPRGGARRRAPLEFARAVTVELRAGDAAPTPFVWPRGEPVRSELLVFADDRADGATSDPDVLLLIGSGSVSTRRTRAYLWTPHDFEIVAKADGAPLPPIWQGARRLFEITRSIYAGPPGGERYRVEIGAEKDRIEQLDLQGTALRGAEATDDRIEVFAGPPKLRLRVGEQRQSPKPGDVQWRRLATAAWRDWATQSLSADEGLIELVWRDPVANVRRDRRMAALLPDGAELRSWPAGGLGVEYAMIGLSGWTLSVSDADLPSETLDAGLIVQFRTKPLRRLNLIVAKPGREPIALTARTRLKDGGFARADGRLFKGQDHVLLDDLRGASAFANGADRVYLRNTVGDQAHFGFTDDLPLWSLSQDIVRLLAGGGDLDHDVVAELGQAGDRRLRIGRYAAQLWITGREVSVVNEPPPADTDVVRSLEWFSILDPRLRAIESRAWRERAFRPGWTLPDDLEGPGVVLLREGKRMIGRPTLYVGRNPEFTDDFCGLQRSAAIGARSERTAAIDQALDHLADDSPQADADRAFLLRLVLALDGVPASAFNTLERLSLNTAAQAALMAAAQDEATQGAVWKLDRELPIIWALIPVDNWRAAFDVQCVKLRAALAIGGIKGHMAEALVASTLETWSGALVSLDPMLALPMAYSIGLPVQQRVVAISQAAQDRLRRSGDQAFGGQGSAATINPAEVSCFRSADSPVRSLLPPSWPFLPIHWEGLDAACAAAIAAAGIVRLEPAFVRRIRSAQAQEPLSFADLYAAAFRSLAQNQPLSC